MKRLLSLIALPASLFAMEDFYLGGASVKLFLPIFKMNFPEIVDIVLPAEGVFHNLVWSGVAHATRVSVPATRRNHLRATPDSVNEGADRCTRGACAPSSDVLDHATSEIAIGSKPGFDATKKLPGESFKRPWPPLIKMDESVKAKVEKLFNP
jgi:4-hydroxy-3-polyprenylbenzoate decarboxylase